MDTEYHDNLPEIWDDETVTFVMRNVVSDDRPIALSSEPPMTSREALKALSSPLLAYGEAPEPRKSAFDGLPKVVSRGEVPPAEVRKAIQRIFRDPYITLADTYPARILWSWRIIRYVGAIKGLLTPSTFLFDLKPNLEVQPQVPPWYGHCPHTAKAVEHAALFNDSIFPTPQNAAHYVQIIQHAIRAMDLEAGTIGYSTSGSNTPEGALPLLGQYGLFGLTNPHLLPYAFPRPEELVSYEVDLVQFAEEKILDLGPGKKSLDALRGYLGLTLIEANILKLLTSQYIANSPSYGNPQYAKAIMVARFDDFIARARESLSFREELNAIKAQATLLGLTKMSLDEDASKVFNQIIEEETNASRRIEAHVIESKDDDA